MLVAAAAAQTPHTKRTPSGGRNHNMASTTVPVDERILHNLDAIALPASGTERVIARSARSDDYDIYVTRTLPVLAARVRQLIGGSALAIVADERVMALHGADLLGALAEVGLQPEVRTIFAGEENKSLDQAIELWHWLAAGELGRRDVLLDLRRRRRQRPRRLGRRRLHARDALPQRLDDARRPGRRGDRRQARRQPPRGEEPDRRLPPAARRRLAHPVPRHASTCATFAPASPRRSRRRSSPRPPTGT